MWMTHKKGSHLQSHVARSASKTIRTARFFLVIEALVTLLWSDSPFLCHQPADQAPDIHTHNMDDAHRLRCFWGQVSYLSGWPPCLLLFPPPSWLNPALWTSRTILHQITDTRLERSYIRSQTHRVHAVGLYATFTFQYSYNNKMCVPGHPLLLLV